jgi:hypothetical protein
MAESLGRLRILPGISALTDADSVWIQGDVLEEHLANLLRSLPAAERFLITDDGQLTFWDETVPRAKLPTGRWRPLAEWLPVDFPRAAFAAVNEHQINLKLVRSQEVAESNLLRTEWTRWHDYAISAPQIRLNQWSFAASDGNEVLIRGTPLSTLPASKRSVPDSATSATATFVEQFLLMPPIPGQLFVERSCIAIPAGWRPDPQVESESIRQALNLPAESLAVFDVQGAVEMIPEAAFVRATRSAVRLTDEALRAL